MPTPVSICPLGTCRWRRLLIRPSLCAHPLNTDPPRNPDRSCGSWNRQESAELQLGRVGGSGHCGNYWALIRGARMASARLKTSHHGGILETVWPLGAPTVTWSSYSPVECVCNTLCNSSVWYSDCEPIYRHDLPTRACSWIRSPGLRPAGTGLQKTAEQMFLNLKPLTTARDTSLKGGVMQQPVCLPGNWSEFQRMNLDCPNTPCVQIGDAVLS